MHASYVVTELCPNARHSASHDTGGTGESVLASRAVSSAMRSTVSAFTLSANCLDARNLSRWVLYLLNSNSCKSAVCKLIENDIFWYSGDFNEGRILYMESNMVFIVTEGKHTHSRNGSAIAAGDMRVRQITTCFCRYVEARSCCWWHYIPHGTRYNANKEMGRRPLTQKPWKCSGENIRGGEPFIPPRHSSWRWRCKSE